MGRRLHRHTSFLGSAATTPPPSTSGAECATNPSSSSSSSSWSCTLPSAASCQSKSWNAARPLVNRFICPIPPGAAAAERSAFATTPSVLVPQSLGLEELDDRDLLRRKNETRLTNERLGRHPAADSAAATAGGRGGSGHAPPFLPQAGLTLAAARLDLFRLIWPMQDTLGEHGSGVRYPEELGCLLRPPRASGGTMETMGPEKALRWLKDDRPREDGTKVEEKEATVDRRNEASPTPVKLLDRPFRFFLFSMDRSNKHARSIRLVSLLRTPDSAERVLRPNLGLVASGFADPGRERYIYEPGKGRFGAAIINPDWDRRAAAAN